MAAYPGAIPTFAAIPTTLAGGGSAHADRHTAAEAEIAAIATELGVNFADTFDDRPRGIMAASTERSTDISLGSVPAGPPVDLTGLSSSVPFEAGRSYRWSASLGYTAAAGDVFEFEFCWSGGALYETRFTVPTVSTYPRLAVSDVYHASSTASALRFLRIFRVSGSSTFTLKAFSALVWEDLGKK